MLDDGQLIHRLDKGNALGVIAGQPGQLQQQFELDLPAAKKIDQIVVAGMGGSALAAEFTAVWLRDRLTVPLVVVRDYSLPAYVGKNSLVVVSSYSGNTEETLAALDAAVKAEARVLLMASGGQLGTLATSLDLPIIKLPTGYAPRLAVLFGVKALTGLLEHLGLVKEAVAELSAAGEWASSVVSEWVGEVPTVHNQAKQLANDLFGNTAVIYGGPTLGFAARKWKIDINENAKNLAFWYELPEFSHNEFTGWLFPTVKPFKVVELQSNLDRPHINQRFDITNRLLAGNFPAPLIVKAAGKTRLEQMIWTILLGDFTSAYLGFLNGIDPTPVDLVEKLKKELK